jgi:LemA protein
MKARIRASIQEIGNQLKRQSEMIPNLLASVKMYMKQEKSIFDSITEARKALVQVIGTNDAKKMLDAGDRLNQAMAPIRALFESTPQLQSAGPTTKLMDDIADTSDKVMYARRTLIDLSADYNIKIVTFPANIVANMLGFKPEAGLKTPETGTHLEVSDEETKTPKVS